MRDEYLISVNVSRADWLQLNFHGLTAVDVVEALARFDCRRNMTSTGIFKPIEPFDSAGADDGVPSAAAPAV